MAYTYEFVVLQVVPDPARGERVNVGLVVVQDKGLDVHMLPSMGKVSALDGRVDLSHLLGLPEQLNEWYSSNGRPTQTIEALRHLGIVTISEKGIFTLQNPDEYQDEVGRLMKRLVLPVPALARALKKHTRVISDLKQKFRKQGILGDAPSDISKRLVVPRYPIIADESLFADFALKNSAFHITETADFRHQENKEQRVRISASIGYKLLAAKDAFPDGCKRYAVYAAKSDNDVAPQLATLQRTAPDGVINLRSRSDMANYIDIIMRAASHTEPLEHSGTRKNSQLSRRR